MQLSPQRDIPWGRGGNTRAKPEPPKQQDCNIRENQNWLHFPSFFSRFADFTNTGEIHAHNYLISVSVFSFKKSFSPNMYVSGCVVLRC